MAYMIVLLRCNVQYSLWHYNSKSMTWEKREENENHKSLPQFDVDEKPNFWNCIDCRFGVWLIHQFFKVHRFMRLEIYKIITPPKWKWMMFFSEKRTISQYVVSFDGKFSPSAKWWWVMFCCLPSQRCHCYCCFWTRKNNFIYLCVLFEF